MSSFLPYPGIAEYFKKTENIDLFTPVYINNGLVTKLNINESDTNIISKIIGVTTYNPKLIINEPNSLIEDIYGNIVFENLDVYNSRNIKNINGNQLKFYDLSGNNQELSVNLPKISRFLTNFETVIIVGLFGQMLINSEYRNTTLPVSWIKIKENEVNIVYHHQNGIIIQEKDNKKIVLDSIQIQDKPIEIKSYDLYLIK